MTQSFIGIFLVGAVLIIGLLLLAIFFNLTLHRSMAAVSEKNQTILPGLIWLNFIPIPILNTVWTMIFGIVTCNAMNKDAGRKIAPTTLAIVYPSLSLLISILSFISGLIIVRPGDSTELFSLMVGILSIATVVLWIIFWVQLSNAKKTLKSMSVSPTDSESLDSGFVDDEF